jgi:hypothetical protein
MVPPPDRRLNWEACFNVRDLGGYPTYGGGRTRWRRFLRADNLRRLTPGGCATLVAYGVRTVVDLRAPFELRIDPSPFAPPCTIPCAPAYLHLPLLTYADLGDATTAAIDDAPTLDAMYDLLLDHCRGQIAAIFRAIAAAPDGGVLVYCHAGKDRTGLITALALELAGVPRGVIAEEYALSERCLQPLYAAQFHSETDAAKRATLERQLRSPLNTARPDTMLATLTYLERRHRGVAGYLRASGIEPQELASVRTRLTA